MPICFYCTKEFELKKHANSRTKFCSKECQHKDSEKRRTLDGRKKESAVKDYEKNKERYKERAKLNRNKKRFGGNYYIVLERDNYKCVKCGSDKQLEVHHKDNNGRGVSEPNNELSNLETLCGICHGIETNKHMGRFKDITKTQILTAINKTDTLEEASKLLNISLPTLIYKKRKHAIYKGVNNQYLFNKNKV